jgi:alkaline phosphatase
MIMSIRRLLGAAFALVIVAAGVAAAAPLRLGLVTDVHAHDTNSPNQRAVMVNYAERLGAFTQAMNDWPADAVIELGDLVNGAFVTGAPLGDPARIPGILSAVVEALGAFRGPRYFVLGNHDVYDLSKAEFLAGVGSPSTFSSFDLGAYHIVLLDAQYTKAGADVAHVGWMVQGTIPSVELEWLRRDLAAATGPTIVFIHQPLDVAFELEAGGPSISNNQAVRDVLSGSGRVIGVFQGHSHESRHTVIDGVHYITLAAMIDRDEPVPPTWAAVTLDPEARTVRVDGAGVQESLEFSY